MITSAEVGLPRIRETLWTKDYLIVLRSLERETGIEPATNGLGSRYSTIELLPLRLRL